MDLWMSSGNKRSYEFLRSFKYNYESFGDQVVFNPWFFSSYCWSCISGVHFTESDNCVSGGRYCAPVEASESNLLHVNGSQIMMEDLMQYCINKLYPEKFFPYASSYLDFCLFREVDDLENCTSYSLHSAGIQKETLETCVRETFNNKEDYLLDDNNVLSQMKEIQNEMLIPFYPYLLLNNISYRGELNNFYVQQAICSILLEEPDACSLAYTDPLIKSDAEVHWVTLFVVLFFAILLLLIIMYIIMTVLERRKLSPKILEEIEESVQRYKKMNDSMSTVRSAENP